MARAFSRKCHSFVNYLLRTCVQHWKACTPAATDCAANLAVLSCESVKPAFASPEFRQHLELIGAGPAELIQAAEGSTG